MALTGSGQLSLRKKDLLHQRNLGFGLKSVRMAHKAVGGESELDLLNLNTPAEMSANGFVQPGVAELNAANIKTNATNVQVVSSSKGLLQQNLSYIITSNTRILFLGFTADPGEIFEIKVTNQATTGTHVVDGSATVQTGTLTAGNDEFVVGSPFEVNKYSTQQLGAVLVYVDGVLQMRNSGNAAASPGADGNYQEIDNGAGYGVTIKFNTTEAYDRPVVVTSNGIIAAPPTSSLTAAVEKLQATTDILVQDVAVVTGNPETRYQDQPSAPDLAAFGNRVLKLETSRRLASTDTLANRTTQPYFDFIRFDTTAGIGTLVLNDTPIDGETVEVWDATGNWGTSKLNIDGNGNTVDGLALYDINTDKVRVKLTYDMPTTNWLVAAWVV